MIIVKPKKNKKIINQILMGNTRRKIFIIYIFLIFIPSLFIGYSYYQKSVTLIEEEFAHTTLNAVNQLQTNISYRLKKVEDVSDIIFMNNTIQSFLSNNDNDIINQIEELKEIEKIIYAMEDSEDIFRVRLFVNNDKLYSAEQVNIFNINDIKNEEIYEKAVIKNGRIIWSDSYIQDYIDEDEPFYVVSCVRALKSLQNVNEIVGTVFIDVEETFINNILMDFITKDNEQIYIIDSKGMVISHNEKSKIDQTIEINYGNAEEIINNSSGYIKSSSMNKSKIVVYKSIDNTDWKIVHETSMNIISENTRASQSIYTFGSFLILVTVIMLIIFIMFSIIISNVKRRIAELTHLIENEGFNDLDNKIKSGDFGKLTSNIKNMIISVRKLTKETYESNVKEREAQLRALQAQINPHFLYNTLDTINWMAIRIKADAISFMLKSLAKYFRLSLSKGKDIVSIEDEVELAKVYLDIQKNRFQDTFEYKIDVDRSILSCNMPKLILQPIIENALLHGIKKNKNKIGMVSISAKRDKDSIVISVSDNGVGIEESKLEELRNSKIAEGDSSHYGLSNVIERIRLFNNTGNNNVEITSVVGEGTCIVIQLVTKE